jgi:hypothetical protein
VAQVGGGGVGHERWGLREWWTVRAAPALSDIAVDCSRTVQPPAPLFGTTVGHARTVQPPPPLSDTAVDPVSASPNRHRRCPTPASTVSAQTKHRHPREGGDPGRLLQE